MLQTFYENYEIFRLRFGNLNGYRTITWNSWMATNCFAATQTISIDKYWLYSNVHWNALDENYGDWKVTTLSMDTVVLCRTIQFFTWEKKFLFLMWNVSTSTWDLISIRLGIWYSYVERTNKSKHFFPNIQSFIPFLSLFYGIFFQKSPDKTFYFSSGHLSVLFNQSLHLL